MSSFGWDKLPAHARVKPDAGAFVRGLAKQVSTPTPSKYRNVKTTVDGVVFDSKREAERYLTLRMLERRGAIASLELQPRYALHVAGVKVAEYRGDFRYVERGIVIVEDAKGVRTAIYRLKKKMVAAEYGIEIVEV